MKTALIILGHGSKSSEAGNAMRKIAAEVVSHGVCEIVEYAFLQHTAPTPQEALQKCLQRQVKRIVIVPLFMQPGVHVERDIPELVKAAKKLYPDVDIVVTGYAGSSQLMAKVVRDLADSCLEKHQSKC